MSSPPPYQSYGASPQDTGKGPLGLDHNLFSLLCYLPCCIGIIPSIIGVIMEKNNKLTRFHSFQGLFIHGIFIVIWVVLNIISYVFAKTVPILALILWPIQIIVGLVCLAVLIFLMVKAYGGNMTKLPVIGDLAESQAG